MNLKMIADRTTCTYLCIRLTKGQIASRQWDQAQTVNEIECVYEEAMEEMLGQCCTIRTRSNQNARTLADLCKYGNEHVQENEPHKQNVDHKKQWTSYRVDFLNFQVLEVTKQCPEQRHHGSGRCGVVVNMRTEGHVECLSRTEKHDAEGIFRSLR